MCLCIGPPDTIVQGSLGVYISGRMAARVLDSTAHGGRITFGCGQVLIGDINAAAAFSIFPGQQNFGNCGIQSANQIIRQATGQVNGEQALLNEALTNGLAGNDTDPLARGGTSPAQRQAILQRHGVASDVVANPTADDISNALVNRRGVIANADAGLLWNDPVYRNSGHAITVTDGDWDENGRLTHVYINDTGTGQQGQRMPVGDFMGAMNARPNPSLNVTRAPVWTQVR